LQSKTQAMHNKTAEHRAIYL